MKNIVIKIVVPLLLVGVVLLGGTIFYNVLSLSVAEKKLNMTFPENKLIKNSWPGVEIWSGSVEFYVSENSFSEFLTKTQTATNNNKTIFKEKSAEKLIKSMNGDDFFPGNQVYNFINTHQKQKISAYTDGYPIASHKQEHMFILAVPQNNGYDCFLYYRWPNIEILPEIFIRIFITLFVLVADIVLCIVLFCKSKKPHNIIFNATIFILNGIAIYGYCKCYFPVLLASSGISPIGYPLGYLAILYITLRITYLLIVLIKKIKAKKNKKMCESGSSIS